MMKKLLQLTGIIALLFLFTTNVSAQVNLALQATASHSGGGATTYGPQNYNDNIIPAYGNTPWGWVSSNGWIEYTWSAPVTFYKVVFYKDNRPMTSCTVQYWDGTQYVNILNYSGTAIEDSITFTPVTSTKLRFLNVSGSSNPNHREIKVYQAILSGFNMAMTQIVSPKVLQTGNNTVKVSVMNMAFDSCFKINFGYQFNNGTPVLVNNHLFQNNGQNDTLFALDGYDYTFSQQINVPTAGSYPLKVWLSKPNGIDDDDQTDDTISVVLCTGMSGNYTIGAGKDFANINAAVTALQSCGVGGPVVFTIDSGLYTGRVVIPEIIGASSTNTITFDGVDQSKVKIRYTGNSTSDRATLVLNGADYFVFKNLTIENLSSSYALAVFLTNDASYNVFLNNKMIVPSASTSYVICLLTSGSESSYSSYGNNANYNLFENNDIIGGYYTVRINGISTTSLTTGNQFIGNHIQDFYYYGFYAYYQEDLLVKNNFIESSVNYVHYSCYVSYSTKSIIDGNVIMDGYLGLYVYYENNYFTSNSSTVINNHISRPSQYYTYHYGIYTYYNYNVDYFHNSVWVNPTSTSTAYTAMRLYYSNYCKVKNNVFYNSSTSGGTAFYYYNCSNSAGDIDYNNYVSKSPYFVYDNGTTYTSLSGWQQGLPSQNQNAFSAEPGFISQSNLHFSGFEPIIWAPNVGVDHDIDNDIRQTTGNATLGADQPGPMTLDSVSVAAVNNNNIFPGQNETKTIRVQMHIQGALNALTVGTAYFSTSGTTNSSDINRVKVYTKDTDPLDDTYLMASIDNPGSSFMVTPPMGTDLTQFNYYIVAVDIDYQAQIGNSIAITLDSIIIDGIMRYPSNPAGGGSKQIDFHTNFTGYCGVNRTNAGAFQIGISQLKFGNINNIKTTFQAGTGNSVTVFTNPSPTMNIQKEYEMFLKQSALNGRQYKVYIDLDNNAFFEESEVVAQNVSVNPGDENTHNITIPCGSTPGYHRMRIVVDYYDAATYTTPVKACGPTGYAEANDYFIFIPEEGTPTVSFTSDNQGYVKGPFKFFPETSLDGNLDYAWDFGSGVMDTSTGMIEHVYNIAGNHIIKLTGILNGCTDTFYSAPYYDTISFIMPTTNPDVNFIASANTTTTKLPVYFTDLTTIGPYDWKWVITPEIVNGQTAFTIYDTNIDREPYVQFHQLGKYTVKLIAKNAYGMDSNTKVDYITVVQEKIMCSDNNSADFEGYVYDDGGKDFSYSDPTGNEQTCKFTIEPICAKTITLDFLDFDVNSMTISNCTTLPSDNLKVYDGVDNTGTPLHLQFKDANGNDIYPDGFKNAGGNVAILPPSVTATSGSMYIEFYKNCAGIGSGFEGKWSTITYTVNNPVSFFDTVGKSYAFRLNEVYFAAQSTGDYLLYHWDFDNDGKIDAHDSATSFTFTTNGIYPVKLITQSCTKFDTFFYNIRIVDPQNPPTPDFEADYTKVTISDIVTVTDQSYKGVYSWRWEITPSSYTFMNGTSLNSQYLMLKFNKIGEYNIKLVVKNSAGVDSITKSKYINVYEYCSPAVATLNADLGISQVTLQNIAGDTLIHNQSAIGINGYTDYSNNIRATLVKYGKYPIYLDRNTNFNKITRTVFIDFNQDGDFDDPGEKVLNSKNSASLDYSGVIEIPSNVSSGLTRMRIAANAGQLTNDGCGPNFSGEFEDYGIEILDNTFKPIITLNGSNPLTLNSCDTWSDPGATAWDDATGDISNLIVTSGTVNTTLGGTYPITYNVTNAAGIAADQVVRDVIVIPDNIPPTITLSGSNPDYTDLNSTYVDLGYSVSDNCSGMSNDGSYGSINTAVVGWNTLYYWGIDNEGNADTVTRMVYVYDSIAPVISLIGNNPYYMEVFDTYTESGYTATDNYYTSLNVQVTGQVNNTLLGSYFLSYCVTDGSGNGPICVDRTVIVEDNTAPTITLKGAATIEVEVFNNFIDPGITVDDNYWDANNIIITSNSTVNTFKLGTYTVTYMATDASGNSSAIATRTVKIVDNTPPTIELVGDNIVTVFRWAKYEDAGVKVHDNYDVEEDITIDEDGGTYPGNTLETGLYTKEFYATDKSGNKSATIMRAIYITNDPNNSIDENISEGNISYYPNPTKDVLNIEVEFESTKDVSIAIYNTLGEHIMDVHKGMLKDQKFVVNTSDLSSGIYYIRIDSESKQINKKFIIAR